MMGCALYTVNDGRAMKMGEDTGVVVVVDVTRCKFTSAVNNCWLHWQQPCFGQAAAGYLGTCESRRGTCRINHLR